MSPEGPKTLVGATEIYKHKPLGADEIKQMERDNSFSEETGSSAWNKGGTWEEKDFSKWAEARIKEVLPLMLPSAAVCVCAVCVRTVLLSPLARGHLLFLCLSVRCEHSVAGVGVSVRMRGGARCC